MKPVVSLPVFSPPAVNQPPRKINFYQIICVSSMAVTVKFAYFFVYISLVVHVIL